MKIYAVIDEDSFPIEYFVNEELAKKYIKEVEYPWLLSDPWIQEIDVKESL